MLSPGELDDFESNGFVCVTRAFSRECAAACVDEMWAALPCDRNDRATWTAPVIRLWSFQTAPFVAAARSPRLVTAIDQLLGRGAWVPLTGIGTFPVRFPSVADPGDAGWHVDGGFERDGEYWVNHKSRGRALLALMLFSDVTVDDAPTRIRRGSHRVVGPMLEPFGDAGLPFSRIELARPEISNLPVELATGDAGDVYLCHPFLVHAASYPHRGTQPRFIAQPPIVSLGSLGASRAWVGSRATTRSNEGSGRSEDALRA